MNTPAIGHNQDASTHEADTLQHSVMAGIDRLIELEDLRKLWAIRRTLDNALFDIEKRNDFK